jgi:acetyl-CoA carboxylase beta subunit
LSGPESGRFAIDLPLTTDAIVSKTRQRIEDLYDPHSFVELYPELLAADGQLTAEGRHGLEQMLNDVDNPWRLEQKGLIDRVIDWPAIRPELASFLHGD